MTRSDHLGQGGWDNRAYQIETSQLSKSKYDDNIHNEYKMLRKAKATLLQAITDQAEHLYAEAALACETWSQSGQQCSFVKLDRQRERQLYYRNRSGSQTSAQFVFVQTPLRTSRVMDFCASYCRHPPKMISSVQRDRRSLLLAQVPAGHPARHQHGHPEQKLALGLPFVLLIYDSTVCRLS